MAQLDRFLNLLVTNNATALLLSEGEIATLTIKDVPRPVMKQPLTSAQILTLVREIARQNQPHQRDAKGNVRFEYACADGNFQVSLTQNGKISARIEARRAGAAAKTNPSAGPAVSFTPTATSSPISPTAPTPAAGPRFGNGPTPGAPTASQPAVNGGRALEEKEGLPPGLITPKATELHLPAGSPPPPPA